MIHKQQIFWFIFSISTWFAQEDQNIDVVDLKCPQKPRGSYFTFENVDNKDGRNFDNTAQLRFLAINWQTYGHSNITHTLSISVSPVSHHIPLKFLVL